MSWLGYMRDIFGELLRLTPSFRGKWRLERYWANRLKPNEQRIAVLPDGSRLRVNLDIGYERMIWLQQEEWDELVHLNRELKPGDVFIDVGANIGLWTLVAASSVGPTGHVFSFEPNPSTYTKLKENVGMNCRERVVTAMPYAASDRNAAAWFSCPKNHSLSAIATDVTDRTDLVEVRTTTIDSLLQDAPQLDRVVGLKIDTEGHELSTLHGAAGVIRRLSPWLIVEFNTTLLDSRLMEDWPVYSFLCERNYCPFLYDSNSQTPVDGKFALDGYCNILFQKKPASSRVT